MAYGVIQQGKGVENDGDGVFIQDSLGKSVWGVTSEQGPTGRESTRFNNTYSSFLLCCIHVFGTTSLNPPKEPLLS